MRMIPVFLTAMVLAAPIGAQETPAAPPGQITVTGEGRVETAPDMATITLGVVTEADTAAEAMAANSTASTQVLERLRGAGIAERDLQTTGLSLDPRWDSGKDGSYDQPQITGFIASNMVTVRVRALDTLGGVLDASVSDGANSFNGLTFGLADPDPQLDEARRRAVADARRKAELYATAAGLTLGEVQSISEQSYYQPPQPMMRMAADASMPAPPVASGEVGLSATVTIIYTLAD